jgi:hypothetical protein
MKKYVLTLAILMAGLSGISQTVVKPGDKIIRYDLIKPSHEFYKNTMTDTLGNKTYEFMMENVVTVDAVNKRIIFARSRQVPVGFFSTDTSVTNFEFKPIRMHEIHEQRKVTFDMQFGDSLVTVKKIKNGVLSVKNYPMKSGYFEDNMIEYIFGYLELKKGIKYIMDNFNEANSGSNPYVLEYVFDDTWKPQEEGVINCRVLHFINGDTSGYLWIDKDTHKVLKELGKFKTGTFLVTKQ